MLPVSATRATLSDTARAMLPVSATRATLPGHGTGNAARLRHQGDTPGTRHGQCRPSPPPARHSRDTARAALPVSATRATLPGHGTGGTAPLRYQGDAPGTGKGRGCPVRLSK